MIDKHQLGKITWGLRAHTNPSYGHDNRRIYYIKPNADGFVECWYAITPEADTDPPAERVSGRD